MFGWMFSDEQRLHAAKRIAEQVGQLLNVRFSVRLWDGSVIPLGKEVEPGYELSISGPGVIAKLLRSPKIDTLLQYYATGQLDFQGGNLIEFAEVARKRQSKTRLKNLNYFALLRNALPFLTCPADPLAEDPAYAADSTGHHRKQGDNQKFVSFHYDLSNEFYGLFLDENMVYTCAYFDDWNNTLEQAQLNKLDMICRKLQLKPGEKLLDIGCGWGALIRYAAANYGVEALGVTLSTEQLEYANHKIKEQGLEGRCRVELRDYADVTGTFDKVSSVGMIEHIGVENTPKYLQTIRKVLPDRGIYLNHGITRTAKRTTKRWKQISPEQKWLKKYIFPGGELDHIGHTVQLLEAEGFQVHDVEGWRDHYALTCKHWCQRLSDNREQAIKLVGKERYRLWLAYLAGCALAFSDGSVCLFQTVCTKHAKKGHSQMPPTRAHLYAARTRPASLIPAPHRLRASSPVDELHRSDAG